MPETAPNAPAAKLLDVFARARDGRQSATQLKAKFASKARNALNLGADEAHATLEALIGDGYLTVTGASPEGQHPRAKGSYRLTEKGRSHLKPRRPEDHSDEQLAAQEAFILLKLFLGDDHSLTRSELNGKLKTTAGLRQLELGDPEGKSLDAGKVDYHLHTLVERGQIIEKRQGVSIRYTLDLATGLAALAGSRQLGLPTFFIRLSGPQLNALMDAARGTEPPPPSPNGEEPARLDQPTKPQSAPELHPDDIHRSIQQLRADQYAGASLIPIFELRHRIAQDHGPAAASHATLDPLLKRMRLEEALELIAISDNRKATPQELADAIPGVNETIFYIVVG